jgi:hypothetical protein
MSPRPKQPKPLRLSIPLIAFCTVYHGARHQKAVIRRLIEEFVCKDIVAMPDSMVGVLLVFEIKLWVDEVEAIGIEKFHDGRSS